MPSICFWAVSNIGSPVIPVYFESYLDIARQTLYSLFAFFLLLPAVFGPQGTGGIRRFLQWWPMASLGVISYGIYLWHETWIYRILDAGRFPDFTLEFWAFFFSVLGLTIVTASLSYFIVEKPALRLKNSIAWWRRPTRGPRPVAPAAAESPGATTGAPTAVTVGGSSGTVPGPPDPGSHGELAGATTPAP